MTRREEIEQAAMQVGGVHPDWDALECFRVGYKEGAKWADKTMIDKACEWLKKWTYQDCLGVSPIARLKVGFSSVKELIEDFKRAMEE